MVRSFWNCLGKIDIFFRYAKDMHSKLLFETKIGTGGVTALAFPLDVAIGGVGAVTVFPLVLLLSGLSFSRQEKRATIILWQLDWRSVGCFIGIFVRDSAVVTKSQDKCIPIYQHNDWSVLFPSGKDDKVKIVQIRRVYLSMDCCLSRFWSALKKQLHFHKLFSKVDL